MGGESLARTDKKVKAIDQARLELRRCVLSSVASHINPINSCLHVQKRNRGRHRVRYWEG